MNTTKRPRKAAMTPDELRAAMAANAIPNGSQLATKLDVERSTVSRWLKGERRIDRASAALIWSVLTKKPKK